VLPACSLRYAETAKSPGGPSIGYTQKNGAVSKVNKKFISQLTRAQLTPSAATTVQVSHALPAVRFTCLLQGRGARFQDGVAAGKGFLCVLRFEVTKTVITVQREFRARFRKVAPCRDNITRWYRQFVETGCLCKGKRPGRPRVSDDNIERVRDAFLRSPRKSVARGGL